jgi:hypothetical protein
MEKKGMEIKFFLSLGTVLLVLGGCVTNETVAPQKNQLIYEKDYDSSHDTLLDEDDGKHLDTLGSPAPRNVGEQYIDTFTKERGRAQSSDFEPRSF